MLFALEELRVTYNNEIVPDGIFTKTWGSPGPSLHDGDVATVELGAILRHLVRRKHGQLWPTPLALQADADRWIDFQSKRLSRAIDAKDSEAVARLLGFADAQLEQHHAWFMGKQFTMVDIVWSVFASTEGRAKIPAVAKFPSLSAYFDRVSERPAYARAQARAPR